MDTSNMSLKEKIDAGYYNYVHHKRPEMPAVLKKNVGLLTPEEISSLAEIRNDYDEKIAAHKNKLLLENENYRKRLDEFRADLANEFGMTGHPKEEKVWELSWEDGHSAGYDEVALYYEKYAELVL